MYSSKNDKNGKNAIFNYFYGIQQQLKQQQQQAQFHFSEIHSGLRSFFYVLMFRWLLLFLSVKKPKWCIFYCGI